MRVPVVHDLKTYPPFFRDVDERKKPFEVRKNDRDYQVGDILFLREYTMVDPPIWDYTGDTCTRIITYILDDPQYVKEGYVILGIGG